MATSRIAAVAAVVVLVGALSANAQQVSKKASTNRNIITAEEIEAAHVSTAYQVVEKVRPEFLRRVTRIQTLGAGRGTFSRSGAGSNDQGPGMQMPSNDQSTGSDAEQRSTAVFVDGTQMGGIEELQQLQSNLVEEIRYLGPSDAETKYGPRFAAGVFDVTLKNH